MLLAAAIFAAACPVFSEEPSVRSAALAAGRAALEDGLYPMAEKELKRYIRAAPSRAEKAQGTVLLVQALIGQDRPQEAIEILESRSEWAKDGETAAGMDYWRARAHFAAGDFEAAVKALGDIGKRFGETSYEVAAARLEAGARPGRHPAGPGLVNGHGHPGRLRGQPGHGRHHLGPCHTVGGDGPAGGGGGGPVQQVLGPGGAHGRADCPGDRSQG